MILVDTSVWVDHLRSGNARLADRLSEGLVVTHPAVVGELACGNLKNRQETLSLFRFLPRVTVAEDREVLALIDRRNLHGRGIGWVDAHLVAAALLSKATIWTLDRALHRICRELDLATLT